MESVRLDTWDGKPSTRPPAPSRPAHTQVTFEIWNLIWFCFCSSPVQLIGLLYHILTRLRCLWDMSMLMLMYIGCWMGFATQIVAFALKSDIWEKIVRSWSQCYVIFILYIFAFSFRLTGQMGRKEVETSNQSIKFQTFGTFFSLLLF